MGINKKVITLILSVLMLSLPCCAQKIKVRSMDIYTRPEGITSVKLNEKAIKDNNLFVVPRGRRINSRLNDNLVYDTHTGERIKTGDVITTQLMSDWVYNSVNIAPEGSLVKGTLTVIPYRSITVNFDTIIRPDNVEVKILSKPIEIPMQNTARRFSVPFGTEFTIQIINDVITTPYEN